MATNFEPHKCVIFVQSTKIGIPTKIKPSTVAKILLNVMLNHNQPTKILEVAHCFACASGYVPVEPVTWELLTL